MNKLAVDFDSTPVAVSEEFLDALKTYSWPGNVRELFNVLEQVFTSHSESGEFIPIHLPVRVRVAAAQAAMLPKPQGRKTLTVIQGNKSRKAKNTNNSSKLSPPEYPAPDLNNFLPLKEYREQALEQAEKIYLENLLSESRANMGEAAKISGVSVSRLYALLKKHNITKKYTPN